MRQRKLIFTRVTFSPLNFKYSVFRENKRRIIHIYIEKERERVREKERMGERERVREKERERERVRQRE